jgi:AcrR family transcriptional regulator
MGKHAHDETGLEELHGERSDRRRCFKAALELCAEQGYRAIREEQLAARAGMSVDALHAAFASKRDLFVALLESVLQALEARIPRVVAGSGTACEALRRLSSLLSDRLRRHLGLARTINELYLLPHEDAAIRSVLNRYYAALVDEGTRVVERGILAGEFPSEVSPRQLAWTVLTAADGLRVFNSALGMERLESGHALTDVLLCCLSCGEAITGTPCPLARYGASHAKS